MRAKFEIRYPTDHEDIELRGKKYKCKGKDMLVMNNSGIFFVFNGEPYYPSLRKLSDVLPKYDVVWR